MLQHHPNDDELTKNGKLHARSISTDSYISRSTDTESVITRINYNGSSMRINCDSVKLIEFLFMDLKTKLKDFVPDGENTIRKHWLCNILIASFLPFCFSVYPFRPQILSPDDKVISKALKEINYAIRKTRLERVMREVRLELLTQLEHSLKFFPLLCLSSNA